MIPMTQKVRHAGYTLIEVLIVIMLLGIIMPAIFTILYAVLQQQAKISEITETKRQGDYIVQFMKEKITREAGGIEFDNGSGPVNICNTPGPLQTSSTGTEWTYLADSASDNFRFVYDSDTQTISFTQNAVTTSLNDSRTMVDNVSFECRKPTTYSSPSVAFSFRVTYNRSTPNAQLGTTSLPYQSRLRITRGVSY